MPKSMPPKLNDRETIDLPNTGASGGDVERSAERLLSPTIWNASQTALLMGYGLVHMAGADQSRALAFGPMMRLLKQISDTPNFHAQFFCILHHSGTLLHHPGYRRSIKGQQLLFLNQGSNETRVESDIFGRTIHLIGKIDSHLEKL